MFNKYSNLEMKARAHNAEAWDRHHYSMESKQAKTNEEHVMQNPGHVDESIWAKAKEAAQKSYGKIKWPVVTYLYEKMGGHF